MFSEKQLEVLILQISPAAHLGVPLSWLVAHQVCPYSPFPKEAGPSGKPEDQLQDKSLPHSPKPGNLATWKPKWFSSNLVNTCFELGMSALMNHFLQIEFFGLKLSNELSIKQLYTHPFQVLSKHNIQNEARSNPGILFSPFLILNRYQA